MSDDTQRFQSGAQRSKLQGRRDLIPQAAIDALGRRLELGTKYGENNWRLGGEDFRKQAINHLLNHLFDYAENGNSTEPNTDAIICNAAFLCHYERKQPFKGARELTMDMAMSAVAHGVPGSSVIVPLPPQSEWPENDVRATADVYLHLEGGGSQRQVAGVNGRMYMDLTPYDLLPRVAMAAGLHCKIALNERRVELSAK